MTNPNPYQPTPEQRYAPPQYQAPPSPAGESSPPAPAIQYAPPVENLASGSTPSSTPAPRYAPPVEYSAPSPQYPAPYSAPPQPAFQGQPYAHTQPQTPGFQYGSPYPGGHQFAGSSAKVSKLAWASLLVSGLGALSSLLVLVDVIGFTLVPLFACPLVGAVLGHFALRDIKRRGGGGRRIALAGVITGWTTLGIQIIVFVGVLILFFGYLGFSY